VVGFVCEAVEGVEFELAGAVGLVEGEDVALKELKFEFAVWEDLFEQFRFEGILLASFKRIVFEDGGGVGLQAVFG